MTWEIKESIPRSKDETWGIRKTLSVLNASQRGEIRKADPSACGLGMTPRTREKKPQVSRHKTAGRPERQSQGLKPRKCSEAECRGCGFAAPTIKSRDPQSQRQRRGTRKTSRAQGASARRNTKSRSLGPECGPRDDSVRRSGGGYVRPAVHGRPPRKPMPPARSASGRRRRGSRRRLA
jgi:hypothetical protein